MAFILPSAFAPELLDRIIDQLRHDKAALKNCSLVCRQFTPRSQKHLFTTVDLKFSDWPPRRGSRHHPATRLLNVLTPRLAYNIRHLHITNYAENFWDSPKNRYSRRTDKVLPLLFQQLHTLKSFTLSLHIEGDSYYRLSDELVLALVAMFHYTRVSEVSMQCVDSFPIALLAFHCPSIKSLNLFWSDFDAEYDDEGENYVEAIVPEPLDIPASKESGGLEVLEIDEYSCTYFRKLYEATKIPRSELTFSRLRMIDITGASIDTLNFVSILAADVGDSLEWLVWDCNDMVGQKHFESNSMFFTLPPSIRSLTLSFLHDQEGPPLYLEWLCSALERNSKCNRLDDIVLVFISSSCPLHLDASKTWENSAMQLSQLDSLLSGSQYPHLREVMVILDYTSMHEDSSSTRVSISHMTAVVDLWKRLPMLQKKGILFIE